MRCNFCGDECRCHINPPCGFCTSHIICEICGQLVCEDKAIEVMNESDGDKIMICPDCEEAGVKYDR